LVSHISSSPDDIEFGFDGFDWEIMKLDEPALNYVSRIHSEAIKRDPPRGRVLLCSVMNGYMDLDLVQVAPSR
jgi:hypothetical protein